jgi:Zn-dependent peptidase ImmA (M78 family)
MNNYLSQLFESVEHKHVELPTYINTNKHQLINNFIEYIKTYLKVDNLPDIKFVQERGSIPMTTGSYLPDQNILYVIVKNRAICDYLRTLAHELVHYKQNVDGKIPKVLQGRDEDLEAEANIEAGKIIYDFAHSNDDNMKIYEL